MQTIYLDISNRGVIPVVYAKQGDVGRKVEVVLTNSGLPYEPEAGSAFSAWFSGASGMGNYTDIGEKSAFSVSNNKVTVELISQMLQNAGEGFLCLVLSRAGGDQIGMWNIRYICEGIPGAGSEPAKDYYTAFSQAVAGLAYPDASLSVAGKAADAAAVGTALADKVSADVAVRKSGDTMTGALTTTRFYVNPGEGGYPTFEFHAGNVRGAFVQQDIRDGKRNVGFYLYQSDQDDNATKYYTCYNLPAPLTGQTENKVYDILSTRTAKVLWSNASPTSSFSSQTITVSDMSLCNCIAVVLNQTNGDSFVCIVHKSVSTLLGTTACAARYDNNAVYVSKRSITPNFSAGTIFFGKGYQNTEENNARAIPVAVIGLY